ncbi:hypothetical protein CYMTET_27981 [Cymbomonas tetramitiformis]|uniref:SF4 helicase domain-containing protein n=1 Tax=Cymbomonas tetramitiformis TaxID=36881 RepID=A0AAE0KWC7_9CHLO|nr:hypothetical protein CYMTET_27981 [Cymbomonas tetramitiformis]
MRDGVYVLRACIDTAQPFPIRGLFKFSDFREEIDDFYNLGRSDEVGESTGWSTLDPLFRVVPGELTIVTGIPNSGKSEWIDALLCNLSLNKQWTFALCSMENKVREHARKLLEKYNGEPFFDSPYFKQPRMKQRTYEDGLEWLDRHFVLLRCEDDVLPSIDWVLDLSRAAVMRYGIRGLVIDPYNELDHQRPANTTETEYVSQMLTKLKRFAQHHSCHVFFVAHPRQLNNWDGKPPGLYDISGSAHFINKCDNGIVVHRSRDPDDPHPENVQILIRKVRNKNAGTIGDVELRYDRISGRYHDLNSDASRPPP